MSIKNERYVITIDIKNSKRIIWIFWELFAKNITSLTNDHKEGWAPKKWNFQMVVLEKTLESSLNSKIKPVSPKGNQSWIFIRITIWSWSSNTLDTLCDKPTYYKRPWCWKRLRAGEVDDRGWDGWMASLTQWTWVWANCRRRWRIGKPAMLQSMGFQRVGHDWVTKQQQNETANSMKNENYQSSLMKEEPKQLALYIF